MNIILMSGVKAYGQEPGVELENYNERLVICAYAEAGYVATRVDLLDVIAWVRKNMPELLREDSGHG